MKTLFFLLMGVFCFAHGQTKNKEDSILQSITEKVNVVNEINAKNDLKFKQIIAEKKARESEIRAKKKSTKTGEKKDDHISKSEALKPDPPKIVIEVPFLVYSESVRGGWIYRLLHKDDFKIKYYKIVGDEKVYLN